MPRPKRGDGSVNVTKERLAGTPFSSMAELNAASQELRMDAWRQLEKAKIKRELFQKEEYRTLLETFHKGMVCRYNQSRENLVRVSLSADGAIQVDINEEIKSAENSTTLLSELISSTSDSLLLNYLKSMDIIVTNDDHRAESEKKARTKAK